MTRVLILDTDELFSKTLETSLKKQHNAHLDVTTISDPSTYTMFDADNSFDIIFIAQQLNDDSGIDIFKQLRQINPNTDGIMLADSDQPDSALAAYEAGIYRYLIKPFQARELSRIFQNLENWRRARHERDWLRILVDISRETQLVTSMQDVADLIAEGGTRLGFERVRVWLLDEDTQIFHGSAERGHTLQQPFTDFNIPLKELPGVHDLLEKKEPIFLSEQKKLQAYTYLPQSFVNQGIGLPTGEWARIPLRSGERFLGILALDNADKQRPLGKEQRDTLRLYGEQASVSLERTRLFEIQEKQRRELEELSQIGRRLTDLAAMEKLSSLLRELHNEVARQIDADNFTVVLVDEEQHFLDICLHTENGRVTQRTRMPMESDPILVWDVINKKQPLLLKHGGKEYREEHNLRSFGQQSRCWLGVPLLIRDKAVGALVIQSYEQEDLYTSTDQERLQQLADQAAGAVQAAYLRDLIENSRCQLEILHTANEQILNLANENEDTFLRATLTAATAYQGLRFSRAMLFISDASNSRLYGRMGSGEPSTEAGGYSSDEIDIDLSISEHIEKLRNKWAHPTPIEEKVKGLVFDLTESDTLLEAVLTSGKQQIVSASEAAHRLPEAFIAHFGDTEYALLPMHAAHRTVGVVIVDNSYTEKPLRSTTLNYLESLLSQTALTIENLRYREARDTLIHLAHDIIVASQSQPLKLTLNNICTEARKITRSDITTIYPLKPNHEVEVYEYDVHNIASDGLHHPEHLVHQKPHQRGTTVHILQSGTYLVEDTEVHDERVKHPFVLREKIRAFIGVPLRDVTTRISYGVMYLNYRVPRTFSAQDIKQAEAIANLVAMAIRNQRDVEGEQERERVILHRLQVIALKSDQEEQIITALLDAANELLGHRTDIRIDLLMRRWVPRQLAVPGTQALQEVRFHYSLSPSKELSHVIEQDIHRGITGLAMKTGETQYAANIDDACWQEVFYQASGYPTRSELDVPVKVSDKVVGVFNIEADSENAFSAADIGFIERLAQTAALAFDNVRRQRNLGSVLSAASAVIAPIDFEDALDLLAQEAAQISPDLSALTVWHHDEMHMLQPVYQFGVHYPDRSMVRQKTEIVNTVMNRPEAIWEQNTPDNSLLYGPFAKREEIASTAALPLRVNNETVGAIFFNYRQPHSFSEEEKTLFDILANIVAAFIQDNAQQQVIHERQMLIDDERKKLQAALDITEAVGSTLDLDQTLQRVMRQLHELFPDTSPCVLTFDPVEESLEFKPASLEFYRIDNPEFLDIARSSIHDKTITAYVARKSLQSRQVEVYNTGSVHTDPYYRKLISTTKSELCLTLMSKNLLMGVMMLESPEPDAFDEKNVALIRNVGNHISMALERSYNSEQVRFKTTVAAISAWGAEIAHDVNREVGNIRTLSYRLKQNPKLSPLCLQYIAEVDASASELAGSLLGLGSPDLIELEKFEIDAWLAHEIPEMMDKLDNGFEITYELHCPGIKVSTHPIPLKRILRHLLRNARHAIADQREQRIILRTQQLSPSYVEVQIEDTGPGIPDDLQTILFQQQVRTSRGGLGLLIVRSLVEDMHGKIRFLPSEPGRGAVVVFTLPTEQTENNESEVLE